MAHTRDAQNAVQHRRAIHAQHALQSVCLRNHSSRCSRAPAEFFTGRDLGRTMAMQNCRHRAIRSSYDCKISLSPEHKGSNLPSASDLAEHRHVSSAGGITQPGGINFSQFAGSNDEASASSAEPACRHLADSVRVGRESVSMPALCNYEALTAFLERPWLLHDMLCKQVLHGGCNRCRAKVRAQRRAHTNPHAIALRPMPS